MKTAAARTLIREIEKAAGCRRRPALAAAHLAALDVLISAQDNARVTPAEQGWDVAQYFEVCGPTDLGIDLIVDNIVSILSFLPQTPENRRLVAWFSKRGLEV